MRRAAADLHAGRGEYRNDGLARERRGRRLTADESTRRACRGDHATQTASRQSKCRRAKTRSIFSSRTPVNGVLLIEDCWAATGGDRAVVDAANDPYAGAGVAAAAGRPSGWTGRVEGGPRRRRRRLEDRRAQPTWPPVLDVPSRSRTPRCSTPASMPP